MEEKEPPRYSWNSKEAYKKLKANRKRIKKLWRRVKTEMEKGDTKNT